MNNGAQPPPTGNHNLETLLAINNDLLSLQIQQTTSVRAALDLILTYLPIASSAVKSENEEAQRQSLLKALDNLQNEYLKATRETIAEIHDRSRKVE
jgi:hypothetical protein